MTSVAFIEFDDALLFSPIILSAIRLVAERDASTLRTYTDASTGNHGKQTARGS